MGKTEIDPYNEAYKSLRDKDCTGDHTMPNKTEIQEVADEHGSENQTVGTTTLRVDKQVVDHLKQESGASQNTEVAPLVGSIVAEHLGEDDLEDELFEEFKEQLQD